MLIFHRYVYAAGKRITSRQGTKSAAPDFAPWNNGVIALSAAVKKGAKESGFYYTQARVATSQQLPGMVMNLGCALPMADGSDLINCA
jgi:hypothetical protein